MTKAVAKVEPIKEVSVPAPASDSSAIIQMIERAARDPNVDIDKMERLFQMREKMAAQTAKTEYLDALSKLQNGLPAVERKGTGHNNKKYARFEDFVETVKPALTENGFSLTFRLKQDAHTIRISGVLGHKGGHQEETELSLPADKTGNKNDVQALGSSISYGKRYVGMTLLGIATEDEDDDGKKAGEPEFITDEQAATIREKLDALDADIGKFCDYMNVDGIAKIPAKQYEAALVILDAKRRSK